MLLFLASGERRTLGKLYENNVEDCSLPVTTPLVTALQRRLCYVTSLPEEPEPELPLPDEPEPDDPLPEEPDPELPLPELPEPLLPLPEEPEVPVPEEELEVLPELVVAPVFWEAFAVSPATLLQPMVKVRAQAATRGSARERATFDMQPPARKHAEAAAGNGVRGEPFPQSGDRASATSGQHQKGHYC